MIRVINTVKLKHYIAKEFPEVFESHFATEMLDNVIDHMQDISHEEQFDYIIDMIPELTEEELNNFIY